jgi:hypothetical protein
MDIIRQQDDFGIFMISPAYQGKKKLPSGYVKTAIENYRL